MDRGRAALLTATAVLSAGAVIAAPLRALNWLAAGADPVAALGSAPSECLQPPPKPREALAAEIGRAAFRSPLLLGGQAARAGLACESCHQAGRGNPQFQFPGLSGPPGSADVTSSLLSSRRGDGVHNPQPIPDLSGPKTLLKVAQDPTAGALEPFILGLITEEFDGPPPPPAVLAGLAAYVRGLGPDACRGPPRAPVTLGLYLGDARRAVRAARALAGQGDGPAALVMVAAARARLGLIAERYAAPDLIAERAALARADRGLADAAQALRARRPGAAARLNGWLAGSDALEAGLRHREAASLFNPARLRAAAIAPLPGKAP